MGWPLTHLVFVANQCNLAVSCHCDIPNVVKYWYLTVQRIEVSYDLGKAESDNVLLDLLLLHVINYVEADVSKCEAQTRR
jgi:hypothetical protein